MSYTRHITSPHTTSPYTNSSYSNSPHTNSGPQRYMDEHTIYCDSGIATQKQISDSFEKAIEDAEKILKKKTNCRFKINLLVTKEGEYFGYGYIWVSSTEIYWMLLGRNPDGTERVEEYPDPDWKPPIKDKSKINITDKTWSDIAEEEDSYVQPMIKKVLPPLITIPGYNYDDEQYEHLSSQTDEEVPKIGHFEISRAYAIDAPSGTMKHRLCARNVPDWIPNEAFKSIFSFYPSGRKSDKKDRKDNKDKKNRKNKKEYPLVNFANTKKGKIVFITFDPSTKDALFTLLMTRKLPIVNPNNNKQKCTLIFMHAFDK